MFRWYHNSTKCYVYLSDVSTNNHDQVNPPLRSWEPAFRKSRWFTRGWALQELLAPSSVEFFCSNRKRLGDKKSLERLLHEITGIAVQALQGTPLSEFSVNERMLWAKTRQAKREEDGAYSLLGIFGIHMPLMVRGWRVHSSGFKRRSTRTHVLVKIVSINRRSILDLLRSRNLLLIDSGSLASPLDRLPYAAEAPFNSYTQSNMSRFASPIPASTSFERYTTGLTDKTRGQSSG